MVANLLAAVLVIGGVVLLALALSALYEVNARSSSGRR